MNTLFFLIFFASIIALPIGLIKPSWIVRREGVSRKKFGLIALLIIFASLLLGDATSPDSQNTSGKIEGASTGASLTTSVQSLPSPTTPTQTRQNTGLSNDNTYINVDGNTVHSPAYSDTIPAGASAICKDGTYSFSQNRRGTCSHHGGVAQWL